MPQELRRPSNNVTLNWQVTLFCISRIIYDVHRLGSDDGDVVQEGGLQLERHRSLNKIGHALHYKYKAYLQAITLCWILLWRNQVFKKISFSPKVKEISKSLDLKDPAIVQGMYIFKQPGIGDTSIWMIKIMMLAVGRRNIINHFKVVKFCLFLYKKSVRRGRSFEGVNVMIFPSKLTT